MYNLYSIVTILSRGRENIKQNINVAASSKIYIFFKLCHNTAKSSKALKSRESNR